MTLDISQFHQTFFEESFEGLDVMETGLVGLEEGAADGETLNAIFRAAHSIKGGAGTFGFTAVADFTHCLEALLDEMRDGRRPVTRAGVDLLLAAVDVLRAMLSALRDGTALDQQRVVDVQRDLERLLQSAPAPGVDVQGSGAGAAASGWCIRFRPHAGLFKSGNDPLRIFRELEELGDLEVALDDAALPPLAELDPEASYLAWTLRLHGRVEERQVREPFEWVVGDCELDIQPLDAAPAAAAAEGAGGPEQAPAAPPRARPSGSIRVDIDKVDAIINIVGELVITQSMLGQVGESMADCPGLDQQRYEKLCEGLAQLERNTRELQENVMRIRMLPIRFAFNRFPRLVRDLSQKLGKQVALEIRGEHTELDKTVLEKIGDPLVHLVRNALDHGIETPERRRAAGKPETGVLALDAYHKGGNIVIEIRDDGAGLDVERILAKARARGLVAEDHTPPEEEVYDLIFHPGFSTAEQVSDVSGRGVGMDVVRRNIKALGGNIEIRSRAGAGTLFRIRLPLTLAILDGQLVRIGSQTYVVPLVSIAESLQLRPERVKTVAGKADLYRLRDDYIPIVPLHRVLGIAAGAPVEDSGLLVVVEADGRRVGLLVDDLLGQQQVVIKSLEANFRPVHGLSGATILGDGTVALILDVPGLIHGARGGGEDAAPPRAVAA